MGQKVAICGQFGAKSVQKCDCASHAKKRPHISEYVSDVRVCARARTFVTHPLYGYTHEVEIECYRVLVIKSVQYSSALSI